MPVLWMGLGQVTYALNKRRAACPSRQERYLPVRRHFSSDIRVGGNTLAGPWLPYGHNVRSSTSFLFNLGLVITADLCERSCLRYAWRRSLVIPMAVGIRRN